LSQDEIWHFYAGSPVDVLCLMPDGGGELKLGRNQPPKSPFFTARTVQFFALAARETAGR
jgi:hypothetical protein